MAAENTAETSMSVGESDNTGIGGKDPAPTDEPASRLQGVVETGGSQKNKPKTSRKHRVAPGELEEALYTREQREAWIGVLIGALKLMGVKGGGEVAKSGGSHEPGRPLGEDGQTIEQVTEKALTAWREAGAHGLSFTKNLRHLE
eukprot:CAMPEP_0198215204 /NCGR_PEP_ID=MMETSP1445-20131203/47860_1 /TAXON_ID=36898 /ORGANISM="Pyramimonas sp., Strain CCMP2087" /LENGTH=144 /DNA_ID=CAMNT_0043890809 /DNA_START=357 /DNA_END=788 /DNA_ORIENTATION=-